MGLGIMDVRDRGRVAERRNPYKLLAHPLRGRGPVPLIEPAGKSTMAADTYRGKAPPDGPTPPGSPEERRVLDAVFSAAYEELRRLAASVRRGDPSATLSPTALVNEAWIKLSAAPSV